MCKVMIMAGIKPATVAKANAFIETIAPLISKYNNDGLGYAAVDTAGNLFGERWLTNSDAFPKASSPSPRVDEVIKSLGSMVNATPVTKKTDQSGSFGVVNRGQLAAITLHTRMATSAKGFLNVHPFVDEATDTSLIHNGIIRNSDKFTLTRSTCDSESILISYLENKVNESPEKLQAMANSLQGYYACGVFAKDASGNRILDVFKSNASLTMLWVNDLDTYVFCTSMSDMKEACDKLGFTYSHEGSVNDGYMARINPLTGEMIHLEGFVTSPEYYSTYTRGSSSTTNTASTCNVRSESDWNNRRHANVINHPAKETMTKAMIDYMSLPVGCRILTGAESLALSTGNFLHGETGAVV